MQPYDWAKFLRERVYELHPQVPENGFTQGGYRLAYNDTPPSWAKHGADPRFGVSFATSLGISVTQDGNLGSVEWDSPAFRAGLVPGMQLIAVNGETYTPDKLKQAILEAEKQTTPINLLMKDRDQIKAVSVDYHGGMRYPHLERVDGTPDRLDAILKPVE